MTTWNEQLEALDALGIEKRGGGRACQGPPEAFTVIGLDVEAEALCALYPETAGELGEAHARACAIIRGVRDRTRVAAPPPPAFVASLGAGVVQPIVVANLGPDRDGKSWVVVVIGRQRTVGLRLWNEQARSEDGRAMPAELRTFRHRGTIDAELTALEANSVSNVLVAMRPSQLADHALMLDELGVSHANISIRIGAKDTDHVRLLLALADCVPEVAEAVDADRMPLADCASMAKRLRDEQVRLMKRKNAGRSRAAQNAAAPARPQMRSAKLLHAVEVSARKLADDGDGSVRMRDAAALLAWARGAAQPPDWFMPAWQAADHPPLHVRIPKRIDP